MPFGTPSTGGVLLFCSHPVFSSREPRSGAADRSSARQCRERGFHPDPHDPKERATVTFTWGSYADFKKLYDATAIPEKARIAPPRD
jgi:hypothetical protein